MNKNAAQRQAQRAYPTLTKCEQCGATKNLQRHHPDYNKPKEIIALCPSCHGKLHKPRTPKVCVICGTTFTNYSHSRVKTCSRECLSELGRQTQAKRKTHGNRWTSLHSSVGQAAESPPPSQPDSTPTGTSSEKEAK